MQMGVRLPDGFKFKLEIEICFVSNVVRALPRYQSAIKILIFHSPSGNRTHKRRDFSRAFVPLHHDGLRFSLDLLQFYNYYATLLVRHQKANVKLSVLYRPLEFEKMGVEC